MRLTSQTRLAFVALVACSLLARPCVQARAEEPSEEPSVGQVEILEPALEAEDDSVPSVEGAETAAEGESEQAGEAEDEEFAPEDDSEAEDALQAEVDDEEEQVPFEEAGPEAIVSESDSDDETEPSEEEVSPIVTKSGWNQSEDGTWYWSDDGKNPVSGWKRINGAWYYFDSETFAMKESEAFEADGKTYVATSTGACPSSKWVKAGGKWYLTDGSCAARSGWAQSGSVWYYLDPLTRAMKEAEVFSDGKADYVANASGACPANAWVKLSEGWYRTRASSALVAGWAKVSSVWYYLDPQTHIMKESEVFSDGKADYVATSSGSCPASSWVKLGSDWYRTSSSSALLTGWTKSGTKWYYLDEVEGDGRGKMLTGFHEIDGSLYFLSDPSGVMASAKWLKLEDDSVGYASASGKITVVPSATLNGGKVSLVGEPGWNRIGEDDRFYVNEDGSLRTGWLQEGSIWYYLDPSTYVMARSAVVTVDGTPYVFAKDGSWINITGDSYLNKLLGTILRDKTGLDLRACYDYVRRNFSYRSLGYWPSGANWQRDYASTMLTSGSGNCYAFASVFQYLAKACSYSSKVIQGWAISQRNQSKRTPHGWVEVYQNGKTYIVDPEISYEANDGRFFMVSYSETKSFHYIYYAYSDGVRLA